MPSNKSILRAHAEMRQQHEAMLDEVMAPLPSDQLDQAKLLQLFEQHQASISRFAPSMLNKVSELHAGLTPQQKSQAVEQLTRLREHMRSHDGQGKM
jgi:Spy/CpxP family protein refolding chaperone